MERQCGRCGDPCNTFGRFFDTCVAARRRRGAVATLLEQRYKQTIDGMMHLGITCLSYTGYLVDKTPNGWYDGHVEPNARVLGIFNPVHAEG